jgi:hypothetical protein
MDIIFDITKEIQMSSYLGREGLKKYANAILRLINVFCELKTVKFLFEIDLNLELLNRVETAMGSEESLATESMSGSPNQRPATTEIVLLNFGSE